MTYIHIYILVSFRPTSFEKISYFSIEGEVKTSKSKKIQINILRESV